MKISIISAMSNNNVIGKNNDMPWHLPADLKHFQKITNNHSIIMGRKTYESIGKPLPNRKNIIISSNPNLKIKDCEIFNNVIDALESHKNEQEIFIIGGGKLYNDTINIADNLYITNIDLEVEGDTFFPDYRHMNLKLISEEKHLKDNVNKYNYNFLKYEIIRKTNKIE